MLGGTDFWWGLTADTPAGEKKLRQPQGSENDVTSVCNFGTDVTVGTILLKPGASNSARAALPAVGAAAAGFGFQLNAATDMGAAVTANHTVTRSVNAGNWTVDGYVTPNVGLTPGVETMTVTAILYKVDKNGVSAELARATTAAMNPTAAGQVFSVSLAPGAATFADGDTLRVEVYVTAPGFAVTGRTVSFRVGASGQLAGPASDGVHLPSVLRAVFTERGGGSGVSSTGGKHHALWRTTLAAGGSSAGVAGASHHATFRSNAAGATSTRSVGGPGRVYARYLRGLTKGATGALLPASRVDLFRAGDNAYLQSVTSDAVSAAYAFLVPVSAAATYFVRSFKAGAPNVFGTSDENLVTVEEQTAGPP